MAQVKSDLMMSVYTDDFGGTLKNFPLKFGGDVPNDLLTAMGYTTKTVTCGSSRVVKPRYFKVVTTVGNTHKLPIPDPADILTKAQALIALSTVLCVDLVGEIWGNIPSTKIGSPTFKTTPYTNIPKAKTTEGWQFKYASDILGAISLSVRIETSPNDLEACQKAGLDTPIALSAGICSSAGILTPRKLIIQAMAQAGAKVSRQAIVSDFTKIVATADTIASCAFCLGYKGESASNLAAIL